MTAKRLPANRSHPAGRRCLRTASMADMLIPMPKPTDIGFPTDLATIDSLTQDTAAKVARLRSAERPALLRLNNFLGVAIPSAKPPAWSALPGYVRDAAQEIGFKPVCKLTWGHWPLPLMRQPQFIGPDGFAKLECYRRGRCYLATMFDDGTAISTAPGNGGNALTVYLPATGDFQADYDTHLRAVRRAMDERGVTPLYRANREALAETYDIFYLYQCPQGFAVLLMLQTFALAAGIIFTLVLVIG